MIAGQGMTVSVVMESWTVGAQYQLRLLEWQPLMDEDGVSHLGIRYRFALPELAGGSGERRFETVPKCLGIRLSIDPIRDRSQSAPSRTSRT